MATAKKTTPSTDAPKAAAPKKAAKTVKPKKVIVPKKAVEKAAPVAARKKRTVKATPSKTTVSNSLDPIKLVVDPVIPHDDISLRAYFIGERRQKMGWHGDSATDWLDALSQLKAEALEKPLKKR